jgi:hypothetical protein
LPHELCSCRRQRSNLKPEANSLVEEAMSERRSWA